MKNLIHFPALLPRQSEHAQVFSFVAKASDIAKIARIERAGRDARGSLRGFQRPQIASHIHEIRDYLDKPNAILPNAIIVAFTKRAFVTRQQSGIHQVTVDITKGPPGWVVDGQQRFTALSTLAREDFEVLVSGFVCKTMEELQKQFILVNNTRPLPKGLVYELLPSVGDLPPRMSKRAQAALMVEALNYRSDSSLKGIIKQHTNPTGIISDTVFQKMLVNSLDNGVLALYRDDEGLLLTRGCKLISEFFHAVQHVFASDWYGHTSHTSRLLHGAGIISMGYVMETLHTIHGAADRTAFAAGLRHLKGKTAWTSGEWHFGRERRPWNGPQVVKSDIGRLSLYLTDILRKGPHRRAKAA